MLHYPLIMIIYSNGDRTFIFILANNIFVKVFFYLDWGMQMQFFISNLRIPYLYARRPCPYTPNFFGASSTYITVLALNKWLSRDYLSSTNVTRHNLFL